MNIIKNIEGKIKLTLFIALGSFITAIIISVLSFSYAQKMINVERNKIYVLDNNVPLTASHTEITNNRPAEYKALITTYHDRFFTLPPDNDYIEKKMKVAMYLIDATGIAQYNNLKEKNYFNNLISTTTTVTLIPDSVNIDMNTKKWTYYGTQKIERPSDIVIRTLITTGYIQDILDADGVPLRTENNPFGAIITNWKTLQNSDVRHENKRLY